MGLIFGLAKKAGNSPSARAFRHRDFRFLWTGSFLSFVGSWIQNVAQGWLVYDLTQDTAKLGLVMFCSAAPTTLLGPIAGVFTDTMNRRRLLVLCNSVFASGALFLAIATYFQFIQYWMILVVALSSGLMATVEIPTRQSLISKTVPEEDLAAAIPINALTFNAARMIGPAIGGYLLAKFGVSICYGINFLSFSAPIFTVLAIRADLRAEKRESQPIGDLLFEGMLYTLRDARLRTLFLMESTTSLFALFYVAMMPAIAADMLGLGKQGLGFAWTSVGVGAVIGLVLVAVLADRPIRPLLIRIAMFTMGIALLGLSICRQAWLAYPLLAVVGGAGVMQFNVTNTLFQLLSPPRLRGRVIAMHVWALAGLSPFSSLIFGWIARQTSIPLSLQIGGIAILFGFLLSWLNRSKLAGVQ